MWEEAVTSWHGGEPLPISPDPSFQSHTLQPPEPAAHGYFPDVPNPTNACPTAPSSTCFLNPGRAPPSPGGHTLPAVCRTKADPTRGWHELQTMSPRQPQPQRSFSEEDRKCRGSNSQQTAILMKSLSPHAPHAHSMPQTTPKIPSVGLGHPPHPQSTEGSSSLTDHKVPTFFYPPDLSPAPK